MEPHKLAPQHAHLVRFGVYPAGPVAVLLSGVGALWFAVVTFQDSVTEFLLCAFVPFYSLYYILTHFEEVKRPLLVQFLCFVPMGIAALIIAKRGFVL